MGYDKLAAWGLIYRGSPVVLFVWILYIDTFPVHRSVCVLQSNEAPKGRMRQDAVILNVDL